ncbi:MAG: hypothetical protein QOK06_2975, partial [Acidimicrobiaceae bacterium]
IAEEARPAMSVRLASFDQKRTEADGFAWNGRTYDSLSKVAFAITGTKWNGPRFFGLRDKQGRSAMEVRS